MVFCSSWIGTSILVNHSIQAAQVDLSGRTSVSCDGSSKPLDVRVDDTAVPRDSKPKRCNDSDS